MIKLQYTAKQSSADSSEAAALSPAKDDYVGYVQILALPEPLPPPTAEAINNRFSTSSYEASDEEEPSTCTALSDEEYPDEPEEDDHDDYEDSKSNSSVTHKIEYSLTR